MTGGMTPADYSQHARAVLAAVSAACACDRGDMLAILLRTLTAFAETSPKPAAVLTVAVHFLELMLELETSGGPSTPAAPERSGSAEASS